MIKLAKVDFREDELAAVSQILQSGNLVQGENVKIFEQKLSEYIGGKHVLAVTSGTAALHLSLLALGIGPGDAVFVPSFTFPATVNVVEVVGARPILVEVDPSTYCIDVEKLRTAIENWSGPEKMKAIVPVHEFGAPCQMDEIKFLAESNELLVIEDAACALGTRYKDRHVGTIGDIGCFSFHPRKAITTGEGGAVVTNNYELYKQLSRYRNHGIDRDAEGKNDFFLPGLNYRMTEFQAVIGIKQLERFGKVVDTRVTIAKTYLDRLEEIKGLSLPKSMNGHSWQTLMVVLPENIKRDSFINKLRSKGIEANFGAHAIHMLHYYKQKYRFDDSTYSISKTLYERGLAIPCHPLLSLEDIEYIHKTISLLCKTEVELTS